MEASKVAVRIVHIGTSKQTQGGVATVIKTICSGESPYVHRHIVTHCDGSKSRKASRFLRAIGQLLIDLIAHRNTIYHVHISAHGSFVRKGICAVLIKLFAARLVIHVHGGRYQTFYESSGEAFRWIIRSVMRLADVLIVLSAEWETFFRNIALPEKIVVLHNAVPLPQPGPKCCIDSSPSRIAVIGRLGQSKGTFDLMRAIAAAGINAELCLAGDGDLEGAKRLANDLNIGDRVKILGWIDERGRSELLSSAQLFALPSYVEGLPMALLEAMSYGLPVVTTPVGGIPSVVIDRVNGILVTPGDIADIGRQVQYLLQNPAEARRLGNAAYATIAQNFDARHFRAALHNVYKRVACEV